MDCLKLFTKRYQIREWSTRCNATEMESLLESRLDSLLESRLESLERQTNVEPTRRPISVRKRELANKSYQSIEFGVICNWLCCLMPGGLTLI